jgi:membrane-associated protease RseP (regulator of RpoE activity)
MMKKTLWASSYLAVFVIGVLASANGCKINHDQCEEHDCEAGTQLYACKPTTGVWQYECQAGETAAAFWCQSIAGKPAVYMACDEYGDEIGDTDETGDPSSSWNPASNVSVNPTNGHREVDDSFVAILKDDPGLILLDSARVNLNAVGDLVLEGVVSGDLAAVLGLQSGDVLVSVNGYSLSSLDDLAAAYSALKNATTFTLTFVRNSNTMQLTYDVV